MTQLQDRLRRLRAELLASRDLLEDEPFKAYVAIGLEMFTGENGRLVVGEALRTLRAELGVEEWRP